MKRLGKMWLPVYKKRERNMDVSFNKTSIQSIKNRIFHDPIFNLASYIPHLIVLHVLPDWWTYAVWLLRNRLGGLNLNPQVMLLGIKYTAQKSFFLKAFPLLLSIHWEELLETAAAVAPRHVGANPQPVPIH